jgi:hypothetical protein
MGAVLASSLGAAGGFDKAASVITLFNQMNNGPFLLIWRHGF